MDLIFLFILNGTFPEDKKEVEKVRKKSARYWFSTEKKLYRRSFGGPYLLCVHLKTIDDLNELHEESMEAICEVSPSHTMP